MQPIPQPATPVPVNRLAIYAHRGWLSSIVYKALEETNAIVKVFYRPGSDLSNVDSHKLTAWGSRIQLVEVDPEREELVDLEGLVHKFAGVDIFISLVGHEGVRRQLPLLRAAHEAGVKLFVPSRLDAQYDSQGIEKIAVNRQKREVDDEANRIGMPSVRVLVGNFAEFCLNFIAMGVDAEKNRVLFTGDSEKQPINLCTRSYVAAAYAQIFPFTPISELAGRTIALSELRPTGHQIATCLAIKHGKPTSTRTVPLATLEGPIDAPVPFALALYCRKIWGSGQQLRMCGYLGPNGEKDKSATYDVIGYRKQTLEGLLVHGELEEYRPMPLAVETLQAVFNGTHPSVPDL